MILYIHPHSLTGIMLSVNIPVYNVEVSELVRQVAGQAALLDIDFEVRVYDDGSDVEIRKVNRQLANVHGVVYKEMPANMGRSAIRNRMGKDAEYGYLLFIDADSRIPSENYLNYYLQHATPGCVLCGGTAYAEKKPEDGKKLLRWVYGRSREAISAEKRNEGKGFIITSNNFLIDRKVFLQNHFREDIGPYGHEDTLLGYDLYMQGHHPLHINNPVEHTGLEDSGTFLRKTCNALENLLFISGHLLKETTGFSEKVRFLNQYKKVTQVFPPFLICGVFHILKRFLESNLTGNRPLLLFFDLYKVGYFACLKKGK